MVEPLTKWTREVWANMAEDVITRPETYPKVASMAQLSCERLRYEQTIQDVEAQMNELAMAILKCSPGIYRKAAAAFGCSEDMERAHELARAAIGDGEVKSSREIIERLVTICETFLAKLEPRHHRAAPICCVRSKYLNEFEAAIKEATS